MRKLLLCVMLIFGIASFSGWTNPPTLAQGTKKEKDKVTKKSGTGVIEVAEGKDGKFRFFVRDADGKLLAMSSPSGFASEKDAKEAINDLKEVIRTAKVTGKKTDKGEK